MPESVLLFCFLVWMYLFILIYIYIYICVCIFNGQPRTPQFHFSKATIKWYCIVLYCIVLYCIKLRISTLMYMFSWNILCVLIKLENIQFWSCFDHKLHYMEHYQNQNSCLDCWPATHYYWVKWSGPLPLNFHSCLSTSTAASQLPQLPTDGLTTRLTLSTYKNVGTTSFETVMALKTETLE